MNIGDIVKLHLERTETMINGSMVHEAEVLDVHEGDVLDLGIPNENGHILCQKIPKITDETVLAGDRYWTD